MDHMTLLSLVFQSIPESILIITIGLALLGVYLPWNRVLIVSIISAVTAFLIRSLSIPYGVHSAIGIVFLTVMIKLILKQKLYTSFFATLLGMTCVFLVEAILVPLSQFITGLNFNEIWQVESLRLIVTIPEFLILSTIAYLIIKKNYTFITKDSLKDD